jgi:uncharacterized phage-associated protein
VHHGADAILGRCRDHDVDDMFAQVQACEGAVTMAVAANRAARAACEASGWCLSNLKLQKILYIAHMLRLAEEPSGLIEEPFEAWDFGPVIPSLYHRAKVFGSGPVRNIFHGVAALDDATQRAVTFAVNATSTWSAGALVAFTHSADGAWAKSYRSGLRGVRIPNRDILDEYHKRWGQASDQRLGRAVA